MMLCAALVYDHIRQLDHCKVFQITFKYAVNPFVVTSLVVSIVDAMRI